MIDFLLKSTISMALLLGVYYLLLQKERLFVFNRFYLLFALAFSVALSFITIEIHTEAEPVVTSVMATQQFTYDVPTAVTPKITTESPIDYLSYLPWLIYGLITLVSTLKFTGNIWYFKKQVAKHPSQKHDAATLVLLDKKVLPHTFLDYIFISKEEHERNTIEEELYLHELAHVTQKHTLDILFIEVLKTILWFNPLLYFYKKAIQLNHEFLADESVLQQVSNVAAYQQLLLIKALPPTQYQLASSLNFSVTKKRFNMMTKATTTKSKALLLKLASLPVIAGLVALLCIETVAQQTITVAEPLPQQTTGRDAKTPDKDKRRDAYFAGVIFNIKDYVANVTINKVYENLTTQEKQHYVKDYLVPSPAQKKSPTQKEFQDFKNKSKYAIWIDGVNVDNKALNNYKPSDFASFWGSPVYKNARTKKHPQPFQYWLNTQAYFDKNIKDQHKKYDGNYFSLTIYESKTVISHKQVAEEVKQINKAEAAVKPQYPGGQAKFDAFFKANFKMPDGITAKADVVAVFTVETNGTLSNIRIQEFPDAYGANLEQEVLRVLKLSPNWIPAQSQGKPVRYSHVMSINVFK